MDVGHLRVMLTHLQSNKNVLESARMTLLAKRAEGYYAHCSGVTTTAKFRKTYGLGAPLTAR